jgi:hypothetical protein
LPNSAWTLERELCKLGKSTVFSEALHKLGLLNQPDNKFDFRKDDAWVQGGAETYTYRFWIKEDGGVDSGYIIKACVAFSPGTSIDNILQEWIRRRKLLADEGVSTPFLVTYGNGVIIEELIPHTLREILIKAPIEQNKILKELSSLAGVFSNLGFAPINAFADLFSRGDDVVVVDFGQDLGPPNIFANPRPELFNEMVTQLANFGINMHENLINELYSEFIKKGGDYQH